MIMITIKMMTNLSASVMPLLAVSARVLVPCGRALPPEIFLRFAQRMTEPGVEACAPFWGSPDGAVDSLGVIAAA